MTKYGSIALNTNFRINNFYKIEDVKKLLSISQKLAAKLRNSIIHMQLKSHKLKQAVMDQKTRWDCKFNMIVHLIELREFCVAIEDVFKGLSLLIEIWNELEELVKVLEPVAVLTTQL